MVCCVLLWSNPSILFWNNFVYIYIYTSSGQKKNTYKTFSPWEFPQNGVQQLSSLFNFSYILPIFIYFFILLPISPIFLSCVLSKKTVGMSGKGQAFGFAGFWIFPSLWASWVALVAVFWEVQGIFNTPKIISPLEKYHEIVFNLALSCSGFPSLSFFLISPYFSHIPFMCLQRTLDGKHSVFIGFWVFVFFSSLWASWVALVAVFWEVQGISNTPKIISPLGKSHEIVFNLALSCSGFPNLSYFPLFRHISPIFLSFASKERW